MAIRLFTACLLAALPLVAVGCGGPEMAPVTGKITVAGMPVVRGTVSYTPENSKDTSGKAAVGEIGPDGTYVLKTSGAGEGAIVGRYIIAVSGRGLKDAEHMPPNRQIPVRYATSRQSGLTAEVKRGANEIDFDL